VKEIKTTTRSSTKKKLCLYNPTFTLRRPICDVAVLLAKTGRYDVTILTPKPKHPLEKLHHQTQLANTPQVKLMYHTAVQLGSTYEWPIPTPSILKTARHLGQFDIVHIWTHSYLTIPFLVFALRKKQTKVIITLDTIPGLSFSLSGLLNSAYWLFHKTLGKWMLNSVDAVTVYGASFVPFFSQISTKKPFITPTGVHMPKNSVNSVSKKNQKRAVPFTVKKDSVLFVGIVGKRKGIDTLLKIAHRLPHITFYVAGDSPQRNKWQRLSPPNVVYLGRISYVPQLLGSVGCLCLPTRGEGLCGAIMEAMAHQCPVVTSRIAGNTDLIDPTLNQGVLCPCDDIDAFVRGIITAMHNRKMAQAASAKIKKNYSWEKAVPLFERVYTCAV